MLDTLGTDASPVSEIDALPLVTEGAPVSTDANAAQSSSADTTDAKPQEPKSLLDVVKRVVQPAPEVPEVSSTPAAKSDEELEAKPTEGEAEAPKTDADLPFHNHPRFKELIQERNDFKHDAESFRTMQTFMQVNNLTGEEVAEGYDIMALLKSNEHGNLQKARDWFAERLTGLDAVLGNTLPADLREKVDGGLVDEDVAREYAQERSRANLLAEQNQRRQVSDDTNRQAEQSQANVHQMTNAVQEWENGIKAKDPDYVGKKAELVEDQVRAIIQKNGGVAPANQTEALALVQQAYGKVNETLKAFAPRLRAMTPAPAGMSARASAAPATLLEAVKAGLNR